MILISQIIVTKNQTIDDINTKAKNLSQTLDKYTEGIIRQSDMLINIISDVFENDEEIPGNVKRLKRILIEQDKSLDQLNNIVIYDNNGDRVLALRDKFIGGINSSDRAFFIYHKNYKAREIFIGPPVRSRTDGKWVITISRRLENKRSEFNGVVVLTLNIENFLELFGNINIGDKGSISLISGDGVLLVRMPFNEKFVGKVLSDSPLFSRYLKTSNSGVSKATSRFDGVERLYAYQKNSHYSLVTIVAFSMNEQLDSCRKQTNYLILIIFSITCGGVYLGILIIRDTRKRIITSNKLLREKNSLMTENAFLEEKVYVDELTGLANRAAFNMTLDEAINESLVSRVEFSLIFLDVDYFKRYNDTYGHVAGDECLKALAEIFIESTHTINATICRYGGEEFAMIMPGVGKEKAKDISQSIFQLLDIKAISHTSSPFGQVTVSIGIYSNIISGTNTDPNMITSMADQALYQAKASGRNTICTWTDQLLN